MLIFPALSLIPRSCSLLSSPSELLWFPGGAMFFLISRSHPSIPPLSDILATPPGPTVQPALICNLCISFLVLAPFFGGDSHSLCCHSALYIPGHSFTMLSYKCLCTQLQFGHTVSSRGKEHVISCTAASVQTPVGTYYCTYVICTVINCQFSPIQFDKHF